MRTWLYNRINGLVGRPPAWMGAAVISSGGADLPSKPFFLVSFGVEQPPLDLPSSAGAQSVPFTVWVHDEPGSMVNIDDAAVWLKRELPTEDGFKVGSMSVYRLKWDETGSDSYDDHFGTNCRPVRFSMMTRR